MLLRCLNLNVWEHICSYWAHFSLPFPSCFRAMNWSLVKSVSVSWREARTMRCHTQSAIWECTWSLRPKVDWSSCGTRKPASSSSSALASRWGTSGSMAIYCSGLTGCESCWDPARIPNSDVSSIPAVIPWCFPFLWCLRKPCHHPAAILSLEGSFQCLLGLTELELAKHYFGLDFVEITNWTLLKVIRLIKIT